MLSDLSELDGFDEAICVELRRASLLPKRCSYICFRGFNRLTVSKEAQKAPSVLLVFYFLNHVFIEKLVILKIVNFFPYLLSISFQTTVKKFSN